MRLAHGEGEVKPLGRHLAHGSLRGGQPGATRLGGGGEEQGGIYTVSVLSIRLHRHTDGAWRPKSSLVRRHLLTLVKLLPGRRGGGGGGAVSREPWPGEWRGGWLLLLIGRKTPTGISISFLYG